MAAAAADDDDEGLNRRSLRTLNNVPSPYISANNAKMSTTKTITFPFSTV